MHNWQQEFDAVAAAPGLAIGLVALVIGIVWLVNRFLSQHEVANLKSRLQLRDDEIAHLQRRIDRLQEDGGTDTRLPEVAEVTEHEPIAPHAAPFPPDSTPTVTLSPAELARMCRNLTQVQAEKAVQHYIGQWMDVTGFVDEVSRLWARYAVYVYERERKLENILEDWDMTSVVFYFSSDAERVEGLKKGTKVTVRGRIKKIDTSLLALDEARFLKVG